MQNPKVTISGFDIEWDLEEGLNFWAGMPTLSMWIPSTVAGLMGGMAAMVGVERFKLCLELGGQQSVDGDWSVISSAPTFEEGFALLANIAWPAGWGRWEVLHLDRHRREARYRITREWEPLYQRALGVCWGSSMVAGKLGAITGRLFGVDCWAEQTAFEASGAPSDEFHVRSSGKSIQERMNELLKADEATSADLAVTLQQLKNEIAERERTERELRDKLDLIQQQETALRSAIAPIIQVWEGVLTVPVMGALGGERAVTLMDRLLHAVVGGRTRHVILDLTAVESVDTSTADHVIRIVRAVELLGARVVITGIRSGVAQIIVSLGMDLGGIETFRNLQDGLKACMGPTHQC